MEDALHTTPFRDYMLNHYKSWIQYARNVRESYLPETEIFFVTGHSKTNRWSMVAFSSPDTGTLTSRGYTAGSSSASSEFVCGPFRVLFDPFDVDDLTSEPTATSDTVTASTRRAEELASCDQCVFIRGFQVCRRLFLPTRIKAVAEPRGGYRGVEGRKDGSAVLSRKSEDLLMK